MAGGRRAGPGKISSLEAFCQEHAAAVEADLRRVYGVRLVDLFRGKLSYRELWNLIQFLPQDTWTQAILRDDPDRQALVNQGQDEHKFGPWSQGDLLMAALIDAVNKVRYAVVRVAGNDDYPMPEPFPRPGMERMARQIVDSAEAEAARRYLDEFNRGAVTPE